jgi:hypothetical protein
MWWRSSGGPARQAQHPRGGSGLHLPGLFGRRRMRRSVSTVEDGDTAWADEGANHDQCDPEEDLALEELHDPDDDDDEDDGDEPAREWWRSCRSLPCCERPQPCDRSPLGSRAPDGDPRLLPVVKA